MSYDHHYHWQNEKIALLPRPQGLVASKSFVDPVTGKHWFGKIITGPFPIDASTMRPLQDRPGPSLDVLFVWTMTMTLSQCPQTSHCPLLSCFQNFGTWLMPVIPHTLSVPQQEVHQTPLQIPTHLQ